MTVASADIEYKASSPVNQPVIFATLCSALFLEGPLAQVPIDIHQGGGPTAIACPILVCTLEVSTNRANCHPNLLLLNCLASIARVYSPYGRNLGSRHTQAGERIRND